jgi:hypothetical protein
MASERAATPEVSLALEMQTQYRGGWMLHWVAKPTRHPARSPPAATVTMNSG